MQIRGLHKMTNEISKINNKTAQQWINDVAAMTEAADIIVIDGSEEQLEKLRNAAMETGELIELNQELLPGCYLHRSDINDVARVEGRTFICSEKKEDAGSTNNWMAPAEMKRILKDICTGSMKGKTMYVVPYSMGKPGSAFAKYGFELTDSIYVVMSMVIMTNVGKAVLDAMGDSRDFIRGIHATDQLNPEKRYIAQFPEENTIISVNSDYGGNVIHGKKCFALRIASVLGRKEGWMAEHMLILGLENPQKEVNYIAAAFPSACGKTNLAMMIPPEGYKAKGWKVWCVGDDIAWLRPGEDGRLWAVNPENGFFGVAPGTSEKTNPNAMKTTRKNTIFTNVALVQQNKTVWWEGMTENPPAGDIIDWKGELWDKDSGEKAAHPNSRFTAPVTNCPCLSDEYKKGHEVPISAIIFGGRRARTAPLVLQSRDWIHGVFLGSTMASERTAASDGVVGVVRRDPMAMRPFCGYNICDYFSHWLEMEEKLKNPPKIFTVNWFRKDENDNFIWPGFGENIRALEWIIKRCKGECDAVENELGYVPCRGDINLEGLEMSEEELEDILAVDHDDWELECEQIEEFYKSLQDPVPDELIGMLKQLEKNLNIS